MCYKENRGQKEKQDERGICAQCKGAKWPMWNVRCFLFCVFVCGYVCIDPEGMFLYYKNTRDTMQCS